MLSFLKFLELSEKNRPLLNYYGSKYSMIETLDKYFPKKGITQFLDLFCGAANVTINVNYPKKIANDINTNMIELYHYIQRTSLKELMSEISEVVNEFGLHENNPEGHTLLKQSYADNKTPIKLYVLTVTSYFGIMRFNKKGDFNKAYAYKPFNDNLVFQKLKQFKQDIQNITFVNKQFSKINPTKKTFVYADPPYLITKAEYNKDWGIAEEKMLLNYLDDLNNKGIKFALSNVLRHDGKENTLLIEWSKKYKIINIDKQYSTSKSEVRNSEEVLIINYELENNISLN